MAVECLKSQQLGLPAQDLHKTRVINTVMGPTLPPPPPRVYLWLMAAWRGRESFSSGVTTAWAPMLLQTT